MTAQLETAKGSYEAWPTWGRPDSDGAKSQASVAHDLAVSRRQYREQAHDDD
jgi:hypothetical protein